MRGHDQRDAGINRSAKGNQFASSRRSRVPSKRGRIEVRINRRVAMAGEMFGAWEHAFGKEATQNGATHPRYPLRIGTETTAQGAGLFGLIAKSSMGEKLRFTPAASSSRAMARAARSTRAISVKRPSSAGEGQGVKGSPRENFVPPS